MNIVWWLRFFLKFIVNLTIFVYILCFFIVCFYKTPYPPSPFNESQTLSCVWFWFLYPLLNQLLVDLCSCGCIFIRLKSSTDSSSLVGREALVGAKQSVEWGRGVLSLQFGIVCLYTKIEWSWVDYANVGTSLVKKADFSIHIRGK